MAMTAEERLAKWERVRAAGRDRFVMRCGVLGWGVPTAILYSLAGLLWERGLGEFALRLAISLLLFPLGGYFWGAIMWRHFEAAYAKERQQLHPPDERVL